MPPADPFRAALTRIFRPMVRVMIGRGLLFPELSDRLKRLYVEACERHFGLPDRRLTDSRVSLLTGLQRKDVRALRGGGGADEEATSAGPLPRVVARWLGSVPYAEAPGRPRALPRGPADGPNFETLVAEVSRDIHPRTVLDEMLRLGLVAVDPDGDTIRLTAEAFLPGRDDAALLGYFGANLGDHAEAAVGNLLAAPGPGPNFERAVHYNRLTAESLAELEALARDLGAGALATVNTRANELQARDAGRPEATGRFRFGAYLYRHGTEAPGAVPGENAEE